MTTAIGTEQNPFDVIINTLDLENSVKEAYMQSISRITDSTYKSKLSEFLDEHEKHISELSNLLKIHKKESLIKTSKLNPAIAKIKIMFANLIGDKLILSSISNYEADLHKIYERINARHDIWSEFKEIFKQALKDENKHKVWLDDEVKY